MNIAIVGAGSSGLVTLKYVLDQYPNAHVVCYEKSQSIRGCWGTQRPDFVSTSTKYTTQFSCYRKYPLQVSPSRDFAEFYQGSEFGDYLEGFAQHFNLHPHIRLGVTLLNVQQQQGQWLLKLSQDGQQRTELFDAVFLCTGLVNRRIPIQSDHIPIADQPETIRNSTVVVVGGGESASDIANHLAKPEYGNRVIMSLRSGIRVSPRYHPIRGVPSDFLRNRLLMWFDKRWRNWVGDRFVSSRIRYQQLMSSLFPSTKIQAVPTPSQLRSQWDFKLKLRAKDQLFNMFHNKSDDFLDAVGQQRIHIVGPPTDTTWTNFYNFEQTSSQPMAIDLIVPSNGFQSRLSELSDGKLHIGNFYHGCVYAAAPSLFLIGFARPIIGNIPSIAEMQARYCVGVLAGKYSLPKQLEQTQAHIWQQLQQEFPKLNTNNVCPVEHIPYTDMLAAEMGIMPSIAKCGFANWLKIMLVPASTTHYIDQFYDPQALQQEKVHMPPLLFGILGMIGAVVAAYQRLRRVWS